MLGCGFNVAFSDLNVCLALVLIIGVNDKELRKKEKAPTENAEVRRREFKIMNYEWKGAAHRVATTPIVAFYG